MKTINNFKSKKNNKISNAIRTLIQEKNNYNLFKNFDNEHQIEFKGHDKNKKEVFLKRLIIDNKNPEKLTGVRISIKNKGLNLNEEINFEGLKSINDYLIEKFGKDEGESIYKYVVIGLKRIFEPNKYIYPSTDFEKEDNKKWIESMPI